MTESLCLCLTTCRYVCKSLVPGVCVNMLDFEGENGTETPVMAAVRELLSPLRPHCNVSSFSHVQARSLYTGGAASSGSHPRHRAVSELFPKLAYTTSDVLVMVCREPFYNRRYLEVTFADVYVIFCVTKPLSQFHIWLVCLARHHFVLLSPCSGVWSWQSGPTLECTTSMRPLWCL